MKLDPILTKAVRLAKSKKYDKAIKILEVEATRYYGSFIYYYILGITYLYSKIFGIALTYLKQAYKLKMRDPNTLLGLAALYLNHGDTDKAVDLYLEVQSLDSSNRIAKKALKIQKKFPGQEKISAWIDSGRLPVLFPPFPRLDIPWKKLGLAAAAAAVLSIVAVITHMTLLSSSLEEATREIPSRVILTAGEMESPLQDGVYHFLLSSDQVLDEYNEALRLFAEHRDEAARVSLNRILESNASEAIKNRAGILLLYLEVPGFNAIYTDDRFTYTQVIQEPLLYRDSHVIWRGTVSNLISLDNHTAFDLLVGNEVFRLEGVVQVDFNFAIPVNPERPIEILGRVIPVSGERRIRIQGIDFHQAAHL